MQLNSAELYDPSTGTWSPTGSLITARNLHTATLLPSGKVLVTGGYGSGGTVLLKSSELYDPSTGIWSPTGSLTTARNLHTATLLPNGKVLVTAGWQGIQTDGINWLATAELYDPSTGIWSPTGSLTTARYVHTATLLPNGQVLVAGGWGLVGPLTSAELYDPATGAWTSTGSLTFRRDRHVATLLANGKALVAGGYNDVFSTVILSSTELYDPVSGTWSGSGFLVKTRILPTATLLPNGQVLVAGGYGLPVLSNAELYDPSSGIWSATSSLITKRGEHTATLLANGTVLVAGGNSTGAFNDAELYTPDGVRLKQFSISLSTAHLSVQSYVGLSYQLQRSVTMGSGTWQSLGGAQPGTDGVLTFSDLGGAVGSQQFYRVVVTP